MAVWPLTPSIMAVVLAALVGPLTVDFSLTVLHFLEKGNQIILIVAIYRVVAKGKRSLNLC